MIRSISMSAKDQLLPTRLARVLLAIVKSPCGANNRYSRGVSFSRFVSALRSAITSSFVHPPVSSEANFNKEVSRGKGESSYYDFLILLLSLFSKVRILCLLRYNRFASSALTLSSNNIQD